MKLASSFLILFVLLLSTSCTKDSFKEEIVFAGGKVASAKTLNKGKRIYQEYCMACHGAKGDGKGVASKGMQVPPRDFTTGVYKFGQVIAGELPHDEDFNKLLKEGLAGTAMLPWDLSEGQMDAVVQYIKTFSMDTWVGGDKKLGEKIVVTKDPYGIAHSSSAIARGKEVYHGVAQCQSCHRAYVPYDELNAISQKVNDETIDFDADLWKVKLQDSEWGFPTLPPDFTWHAVRSAQNVKDLYIRLNAGVAGSAMPSWKDTLEDQDIWAVAYYVKYLMDLRNTKERDELMKSMPR